MKENQKRKRKEYIYIRGNEKMIGMVVESSGSPFGSQLDDHTLHR